MAYLLVDGHAHLHDCFGTAEFLWRAAANLGAAADRLGIAAGWTGCLLLAERRGEDYLERLLGGEARAAGWRVERSREPGTVEATRAAGGARILAVAGKQVVTAGGLELLALGTTAELPDGMPLMAAVGAAASVGSLPVLPWGVGKWWFGRGARTLEALETATQTGLVLGDNAGRPRWTPPPPAFLMARARGIPVLPGSDPLPLPDQVRRPGRYGFVLHAPDRMDRPAETIKRAIRGMTTQPRTFGRRVGIVDVVRTQLALRTGRRRRAVHDPDGILGHTEGAS